MGTNSTYHKGTEKDYGLAFGPDGEPTRVYKPANPEERWG